jgi:hypothetical protein
MWRIMEIAIRSANKSSITQRILRNCDEEVKPQKGQVDKGNTTKHVFTLLCKKKDSCWVLSLNKHLLFKLLLNIFERHAPSKPLDTHNSLFTNKLYIQL